MIVGLGETGLSFARYLAAAGESFSVFDDNPRQENMSTLKAIVGSADVSPIVDMKLDEVDEIFLSPGVPLAHPMLQAASAKRITIRGDVELFGELAKSPIVAVTGTNGKSTVSQLVFEILSQQRSGVVLAGNIGTPVLDVLSDEVDFYVVEVSSYQLELATALPSEVAVVLNLSPDHLDRYSSADAYYQTKLAIYRHCSKAVVSRSLGFDPDLSDREVFSIGLDAPDSEAAFGLLEEDGHWFVMRGTERLLRDDELKVSGAHYLENVMAALAIGTLLGLALTPMLDVVRSFTGLKHRNELIATINGVRCINDSKATNPGAMLAAVKGQVMPGRIHLIAGGQTKGLDFTGIADELMSKVSTMALIGESSDLFSEIFSAVNPVRCDSMANAVEVCREVALPGDVIMLSPGCASLDQYPNFAARGDDFRRVVEGLTP